MPASSTSAGQEEPQEVDQLLRGVASAQSDAASCSAAALAQVCRSVITGEGPCVAGRVHFSRTLDAEDAALCARILVLAGRDGAPVSREEADALFEIDAAGGERCDGGCFDDLLAKAVMHHLLAACGRGVPARDIALSAEVPLERWASAAAPGRDVRTWLARRLRDLRSPKAAETIVRIMSGTEGPGAPPSIAGVFDIAA